MKTVRQAFLIAGVISMVPEVNAHTSYSGTVRDLGPVTGSSSGSISGFNPTAPYFKTINTAQTVTSNFGWAHGTDADFGDAHHIKAYRFTLAEAGWATISVASNTSRGTGTVPFMPAFSLYTGLLHTSGGSDYDTAGITTAYLATLGSPQPREGAFYALGDWKMGNDASLPDGLGNYNFSELSSLTYVTNAADGTAANYGSAAGIQGDGLADGTVTAGMWLLPGTYSLMVGGADINGTDALGSYGIDVSLSVIPEPSSFMMAAISGLAIAFRRRRA
jgi:PEP-CTERM motif